MSTSDDRLLAILYEHPAWFGPLFAELERRRLPFERVDAASHIFDPSERRAPWRLVVNRASPSAYLRGNASSTFHTLHWLRHLERIGVPVVNGSAVYALEISKATQLDLLESLRLPYPRTRVINDPARALDAAEGLRFPVLVKANVGGSGAGIVRYDTRDALGDAITAGRVAIGIDGTALVQEAAPLRGGHITRIETLGGRFLYAIEVHPAIGSYDLCPADACRTTTGEELLRATCAVDAPANGLRVAATVPPPDIIRQAERIARAARLDVGGIEYLVDDRDGRHYFYDINALSNFVADAPRVIGFDPFATLVDWLETRLAAAASESPSSTGEPTESESLSSTGEPAAASIAEVA